MLKTVKGQPGSSTKHADKALRLVDKAGLDLVGDEVLLNGCLDAFICGKEFEGLREILEKVAAASKKNHSAQTYGTLIRAHGALRNVEMCRVLFKEVANNRADLEVNENVLNCMLDALVRNDSLDEARKLMSDYKVKVPPSVVMYSTLLKGCVWRRDADLSAEIFQEMLHNNVKPNEITFNTIIDACAAAGKMDKAQVLLEKMKDANVVPDMVVFQTIMKGYSVSGDHQGDKAFAEKIKQEAPKYNTPTPQKTKAQQHATSPIMRELQQHARALNEEKALEVYEKMCKKVILPSLISHNMLIQMFAKKKQPHRAEKWLDDMIESGTRPNIISYGGCLHAYATVGDYKSAQRVFNQMVAERILPNTAGYNHLLQAYSKGRNPSLALKYLDSMEETYNLRPNHVSYNVTITAFCQEKQPDQAVQLFNRMDKCRIEPDLLAYQQIAQCFAAVKKPKQASYWLDNLFEAGLVGEEIYVNGVLASFAKVGGVFGGRYCDLEHCFCIFEGPLNLFFKIQKFTQTNFFWSQVDWHKGKQEETIAFFEKIGKEYKLEHSLRQFNTVLDLFAKQRDLEKVDSYFKRLVEAKGIHAADVVTYNCLLRSCVPREGQGSCFGTVERAESFFAEMTKQKVQPDLITYSTLIDIFAKNDNPQKAVEIFNDMTTKTKIQPDLIILNSIISAYSNVGDLDNAHLWFEKLKSEYAATVTPDVICYSNLIKTCAKSGDLVRATKYFDELIFQTNLKPNLILCNNYLHAFSVAADGGGDFFFVFVCLFDCLFRRRTK